MRKQQLLLALTTLLLHRENYSVFDGAVLLYSFDQVMSKSKHPWVSMIMVHKPSRVAEKERQDVCTCDEHRKLIMEKVGKLHGDVWSEVRNSHSRHMYLILTQPELGAEYWVTQIFSMVQKKAWLGLSTFTVTDLNHPIIMLIRHTKKVCINYFPIVSPELYNSN